MKSKLIALTIAAVLSAMSSFGAITITTTSKTFTKDGGAASVSTGGEGAWTATTDADWIIFNRGSGNAGVSCVYTVSANYSADTRTATIDIAGNIYTVTQTGYTAVLSPSAVTKDYAGGSGTVTVTCDAGVSWTAKANVDWLSVSPTSGRSSGSVTYTVAVYSSGTAPRSGSITIAGQAFTVTQTGTDVTISPDSKSLEYYANVFEVDVSALSSTHWTITPNASWISVVDEGYGYGDSTILIAVGQNPSVDTRTGTVKIGSKTLTVTQTGMTAPVLSITPTEAAASPVGAYGNIAVYATPDAIWTAEALSSWITISEGASGAGNGNIKYVAAANPLLSPRTGEIQITPPVHDPQDERDVGRELLFEDGGVDACLDLATGSRTLSKSLSTLFDGSCGSVISGDDLPAQRSNDFSVMVEFNLQELGRVHRLLGMFGTHALYVNAENKVCFDEQASSYEVADTNTCHAAVLTQDDSGVVRIYAGREDATLQRVAEFAKPALHDFTAGTTPIGEAFELGYANYPSSGYLNKAGLVSFAFWARALGEREAANASNVSCDRAYSRSVPEAAAAGAPSSLVSTHFRCSGNGMYTVSTNDNFLAAKTGGVTVSGWSEFPGRTGLRQRAMASDGEGTIVIDDVNKIFQGTYTLNNGNEMTLDLNQAGYYERGRHFSGDSYYYYVYPYPVTCSGPFDGTYNFWIYLDRLPSVSATIFTRDRVSGQGTDASGHVTNSWYESNVTLKLEVTDTGSLKITQNDSSTVFTGGVIEPKKWTMITLVGIDQRSITAFKNGAEIGNVSTTLSFGYFPPTDARYYYAVYVSGYNPPRYKERAEFMGSVIPTVQSFTIGGWDGAIDEFSLYHDALTSAQVKALYDACPPTALYHTVTQGVIDPIVSPTALALDAVGGSTNVQLTVAANTQWSAATSADWISLTSPSSGAGSSRVSFDVASNPSTETRTGTLTLAGKTVTVTQDGLWSQLSYDGTVFTEVSDSGFIDVQVEGAGQWTATTDASWLTLLDDRGIGSGSVMFVVDDFNTTVASRTANVTIAGKTIVITQRGYELSIDPAIAEIGSNAGAGEIGITAPIDAVWEAIVTADWISLVGGSTGVGSGTLRYTVADNTTGGTRTGKIVISGQEYTITQHANLTLVANVEGQGTVDGAGDFETYERATLVATPAVGYAFTHWSGDAVGVSNAVSFIMDMPKTVTAHFIPEGAAQRLAEEKAAQGGFYTRDQIHSLEMGNLLFDVDSSSGKARVGLRLMETADLAHPDWKPVGVSKGDIDVGTDGSVGVTVPATGRTKFFRMVAPDTEER